MHEQKVAKKKLAVLHDLDYIGRGGLTRKGRIAGQINGYELLVAETYVAGLLDALDEHELCVLMVAIVYEARRRSRPRRLPRKKLGRIAEPAFECSRTIRAAEKIHRLEDLTKQPEFGLSLATWHWSGGCEFDDLAGLTDLGPGDIVRNFRLAIQLMRQTIKAVEGDESAAEKLRRAIRLLNRDVVDAERQLRTE